MKHLLVVGGAFMLVLGLHTIADDLVSAASAQTALPQGVVRISGGSFRDQRDRSELLRDLSSRPTPGLSNDGTFLRIESSFCRCNKLAREIFFMQTACQMKRAMPQMFMPDACERGEKARQALSLSLEGEVVEVAGPDEGEDAGVMVEHPTPAKLERVFRELIAVPADCKRRSPA